jgi:hypothetical protein
MPSPTAADIFATYPHFLEADPDDVTLYLTLAEANQADLWGDARYQQAIALNAACSMWQAGLGTGAASSSSAGQVTSKHIGSLSVSYAGPSSGASSGGGGTLPDNPYCNMLGQLLAGAIVPITVSDLTLPYGCDGGNAQNSWWSGFAPFAYRRWWP